MDHNLLSLQLFSTSAQSDVDVVGPEVARTINAQLNQKAGHKNCSSISHVLGNRIAVTSTEATQKCVLVDERRYLRCRKFRSCDCTNRYHDMGVVRSDGRKTSM